MILQINNLVKKFDQVTVLDHINLQVEQGDCFGFLGTNGAGKTTLFRIISNVLEPTQGTINIFGKNLSKNSKEIKQRIGYLPDYDLHTMLSGRELLAVTAAIKGFRLEELLDKINMYCEILQLSSIDLGKPIKHYSHGMKKKLYMMNALLYNPELLILDEPFSGLDAQSTFALRELVNELCQSNRITVFMTEHRLDIAEFLCNRIAILNKGKIVFNSNPDEIKTANRDLYSSFINVVKRSDER